MLPASGKQTVWTEGLKNALRRPISNLSQHHFSLRCYSKSLAASKILLVSCFLLFLFLHIAGEVREATCSGVPAKMGASNIQRSVTVGAPAASSSGNACSHFLGGTFAGFFFFAEAGRNGDRFTSILRKHILILCSRLVVTSIDNSIPTIIFFCLFIYGWKIQAAISSSLHIMNALPTAGSERFRSRPQEEKATILGSWLFVKIACTHAALTT